MENEQEDAYLSQGDSEIMQPFDVQEHASRRGMMILLGGFVFLLVLAFIVLKLFSSGTRDRDQTPKILADNTPYKEIPLEQGGAQTPNQDKEIYQKLNGTLEEEPVNIAPIPEKPLPKPKVVKPNISVNKPVANVVIKQAEVKKPLPKKPIVNSSSNYVVQVASLRSREEANVLWTSLSTKMKPVFSSSHFADVKRADLGDRGIYYRLRISGLASKSAANSLCTQLKSRGQDCIVTKK